MLAREEAHRAHASSDRAALPKDSQFVDSMGKAVGDGATLAAHNLLCPSRAIADRQASKDDHPPTSS